MNFRILIQARLSSTRLPGKVLFKLGDKNYSSLSLMIKRLTKKYKFKQIAILTTTDDCDNAICEVDNNLNIECFRGSKEDVLERYYESSKKMKIKNIIRLTSDCPFIDVDEIERVLQIHMLNKNDYTTNSFENSSIVDGMDVEVISFKALESAYIEASLPSEREHVTFYFTKNKKFKVQRTDPHLQKEYIRLTLDTPEDFRCISKLINLINDPITIGMKDIVSIYKINGLNHINGSIEKNSGWISAFKNLRANAKLNRSFLTII